MLHRYAQDLAPNPMSGWIKVEKDLESDPRMITAAAALEQRFQLVEKMAGEGDGSNALRNVTQNLAVTVLIGALVRIWMVSDTHVGEDNVLPLSTDLIDKRVGVPGFCQLLPQNWLQILDPNCVKLPNFHGHNGTIAKKRSNNAERQARFRERQKEAAQSANNNTVTSGVTNGLRNALPASPDQDLDQDLYKRNPLTPFQGANGANAPSGRKSRNLRAGSLAVWRATTLAIDAAVRDGGTWSVVDQRLNNPAATKAIAAVGGYRRIAERKKSDRDLEGRFREAFEQLAVQRGQPEAIPDASSA